MYQILEKPRKKDWYIECLSEDKLDFYYLIRKTIEEISLKNSGKDKIIVNNMLTLIDNGIIFPETYNEKENEIQIVFKFWSFHDGKFKFPWQMRSEELNWFNYYIKRWSDVN